MYRLGLRPGLCSAAALVIVTALISGCAGQPETASTTEQPERVCANGQPAACTTYLGETVECKCVPRGDLYRVLGRPRRPPR